MSERYGYVNFHDDGVGAAGTGRMIGRWTFRLDPNVDDFGLAWTAVVKDFREDRDAITYAHQECRDLHHGDLVIEFPDILARHGLHIVEQPGEEITVVWDTPLVDPDERCDHEEDDGKVCGIHLNGDSLKGKCGDHADELHAAQQSRDA